MSSRSSFLVARHGFILIRFCMYNFGAGSESPSLRRMQNRLITSLRSPQPGSLTRLNSHDLRVTTNYENATLSSDRRELASA